jgi:diguanylate cyclase (GGDEF)-like protein
MAASSTVTCGTGAGIGDHPDRSRYDPVIQGIATPGHVLFARTAVDSAQQDRRQVEEAVVSADSIEVVYGSARTRVVRVWSDECAGPVVRKQAFGPDANDRISNERHMLQRLEGLAGVPRLLPADSPETIAFAGDSAVSLAGLAMPWQVPSLVDLACGVAGVLAAVHRRGVVHRDVSPGNVLVPVVNGVPVPDRQPILIDFELATTLADGRHDAGPQESLVGTLPYLAPEQTGRTGRRVDHRADLYALGAVLYELAVGGPPFGRDDDPLRLVHDHLARTPIAPAAANPEVPPLLSDIIMRLLAKDPDQRYQSGEGLAWDLSRMRSGETDFPLGARDFPMRLSPPAQLVGREAPLSALSGAFAASVSGDRGVVLVTGPPGVGKTALIDRLRPVVAAAGGRFVTGKFDQYRRDLGADAVGRAFGDLGGQLLAEPDDEVARLREQLLSALGANAGLAAALMPAFATLLDVEPEPASDGDPQATTARIRQIATAILRAVAGRTRPVVIFVDDLQWAGSAAFGFLDTVIDEPDLPGVLVIGAFREADVDETHPLTAILQRLQATGGELRLDNLPPGELGTLLAQVLRVPQAQVTDLVDLLVLQSGGNPYDTMELINALRRDGVLVPDADGWRWDADTVRRFVGRGDVVDLLSARIETLPAAVGDLLGVMAVLGGDLDLELLATACGRAPDTVLSDLIAAADEGLVTIDRTSTPQTAGFKHDRVQQAAYGRLDETARKHTALLNARRLAVAPAYEAAAAHQYLIAWNLVADPMERRAAVLLLREAAAAAQQVTNHTAAEALLATAVTGVDPADDDYHLIQAQWHAMLCCLGRFDQADRLFACLEAADRDPIQHTSTVCEQIVSWTNRGNMPEALNLGLTLLSRLGNPVPDPADLGESIDAGLETMLEWLSTGSADDDLSRPELDDPRLLSIARVINRLIPPAFFSDHTLFAWLVTQSAAVWAQHGAAAALVGPVSHAGFVTIPIRNDYRSGYEAVCRVLHVSRTRGYDPDTAQAEFLHALGTIAWYEPVENAARLARQAHDGLLRGGDLQNAANTYWASVPQLLDCAPTLDRLEQEVHDALALCARIGYDHATATLVSYRQLLRALHGDTHVPGTFTDQQFDETLHQQAVTANPTASVYFHLARALSAAVFGDEPALMRHVAAMTPLLPLISALYPTVTARTLVVLAASARARTATGTERDTALADLSDARDFLTARATDQPGNFRHLARLADAEHAWLTGDTITAETAFDGAAADLERTQRSWHRGIVHERAARFYLDRDMQHAGFRHLREALDSYTEWGATGKVKQLLADHPRLAAPPRAATTSRTTPLGTTSSLNVSTDMIDLLAVLEAARTLSSETDIDRLRTRVQRVLQALTGATKVHLVLWDHDDNSWRLPADTATGRPAMSLTDAAERNLLPLTALRYVERTREPLLIDDVARDDRVARDPYLADQEHSTLLVVPILSQGSPKAMLILENRLTRQAFTAARLDSIHLIAGQLTVSLDNALAYTSMERKVTERTRELAEANQRLEQLTFTDPLTTLANRRRLTDILDIEWQRAQRSGEPLSLAMIDIDNFKKYNDHYGHHGGDACLTLVARTLADNVRVTDLVARYGGEEFTIIMPATSTRGAYRAAERARRAVAGLREPHATNDTGIVTISIGVATTNPTTIDQPTDLIKIADQALYQAKNKGRNQVAAARP